MLAAAAALAPSLAMAVPTHVPTFAYYGLNDMNATVPARTMASLVDIVDDDGYSAEHADAFKKAGGHIAIAYTDPTYAYYCAPPLRPPAGKCTGQVGKFVTVESAFLHDAGGARVAKDTHSRFLYEEILNPASPDARRAYAQATATVLRSSPLLDGFEADDSGSPYSYPGGALGSNLYDGFDGRGVELVSEAEYIAAERAMLRAAGKPVIVNGGDPQTLGPAYNGAFLDEPFVMGQMFEGCFNNEDSGLYTSERNDRFGREENGLLAVAAHRKYALCMPTGPIEPARRLYAYAAYLLAYDGRYLVYGMNQKLSDGPSLYPETQIVPTQPRRSATTSIAVLRRGPLYVREFGACYLAGRALGPCAAVVNPSGVQASLFGLDGYRHAVALDTRSIVGGGRVNVDARAPRSLDAGSAAILVR